MFFYAFGNEGDAEAAFFVVIIGTAITGEFDRRAHFLEDLEIVVETAFGDTDLVGTVRGGARGFQMNEIIEANKPMQ